MYSFLKDSFRGFVSWKQKSQITRFVSIRKDSYTNPASLLISLMRTLSEGHLEKVCAGKITSTGWASMNRLTLSSFLRIRSPTRRKLILVKANYETERLFIATDLVVVGASVVVEVFVSPTGVAPEAESLGRSANFCGQFNSDFAIFDFLNLSVSASVALMQTSCFTT